MYGLDNSTASHCINHSNKRLCYNRQDYSKGSDFHSLKEETTFDQKKKKGGNDKRKQLATGSVVDSYFSDPTRKLLAHLWGLPFPCPRGWRLLGLAALVLEPSLASPSRSRKLIKQGKGVLEGSLLEQWCIDAAYHLHDVYLIDSSSFTTPSRIIIEQHWWDETLCLSAHLVLNLASWRAGSWWQKQAAVTLTQYRAYIARGVCWLFRNLRL